MDDGSTVAPRGVLELAKLDKLPNIEKETITGRSKADLLTKFLVVSQILWMLLQTIARKIAGLPVTLLELNALAYIDCALLLYLIWWKKPRLQDINESTEIHIDALLAAYMSSRNLRTNFRPLKVPGNASDRPSPPQKRVISRVLSLRIMVFFSGRSTGKVRYSSFSLLTKKDRKGPTVARSKLEIFRSRKEGPVRPLSFVPTPAKHRQLHHYRPVDRGIVMSSRIDSQEISVLSLNCWYVPLCNPGSDVVQGPEIHR